MRFSATPEAAKAIRADMEAVIWFLELDSTTATAAAGWPWRSAGPTSCARSRPAALALLDDAGSDRRPGDGGAQPGKPLTFIRWPRPAKVFAPDWQAAVRRHAATAPATAASLLACAPT